MNLGEGILCGDLTGERTPSSASPGEAAGLNDESLYLRFKEVWLYPASEDDAGEAKGGLMTASIRCCVLPGTMVAVDKQDIAAAAPLLPLTCNAISGIVGLSRSLPVAKATWEVLSNGTLSTTAAKSGSSKMPPRISSSGPGLKASFSLSVSASLCFLS